jgi:hypothetical protein
MKVLVAGLFLVAAGVRVHATLLFYDSFDYAASVGQNLSTASAANWAHSGGAVEPVVGNAGGLTYGNLAVSGDSFTATYDGSGASGVSGHGLGSAYTSGTLYYSLLMKVTDVGSVSGFSTGVNLTGGSFMAGLDTVAATTAPGTANTAAPLLIRSGDGTQFSSTYQLGTAITATSADRTWTGSGMTFTTGAGGETVFVVLKYDFGDNSASLFVDPTPGDPEPAATLHVTTGTALTLNSGISSFFLRNNSVEPDGMVVDELRIGTTWADVTPVPEPSTAVLFGGAALALLLAQRLRRPAR